MRKFMWVFSVLVFSSQLFGQLVTDPLPYAAIANPLPDTMDQLKRDSFNLKFSPIRINQAGYRPQDKKYFYYVGSGATAFTVIDQAGKTVGNGTLTATANTSSGQLKIKASNNATLVSGGDTRYTMDSPIFSGPISEGLLPDLAPGAYRIVVGTVTSAKFVINERIYSWVRDALLKFFGVNRCGNSQSWFHPACHLKDAATGGWHDCGDHLKEGATMSYTAAVLGLAAAVFADRDADVYSANQGITQTTDGIPDILYEAKHGADFVLQSYDKAGGQVSKMITSMGGFGNAGCGDDHSWWGQPQNQDLMPASRGGPPRCARNEPTTDYLGKYAASLAFVSKKFRPYDAPYADRCLKAAKAIYDFTKPKLDNTNTSAYNGATIVTDDAAFGCLALLWATGERKYLNDLCYDKTIGVKAKDMATFPKLFEGGLFTNNDPLFSKTSANTDWASTQTHVLWGFFRLILNDKDLCQQLGLTETERLGLIEKTMVNLMANLSSVGAGTQSIPLPDGVLWVPSMVKYDLPWFTMHTQMEWVWNRYQAGNITDMYYYYDIASKIQGLALPNTPASTNWKTEEIKTVMVRMLDYMFGVNPWDISMVYGIGAKNFNHPHHRAANPEGKNVPGAFYKYCPPVGALQGGYIPITPTYSEFYNDYMHAETGIDGTTNILMPVIGLAKDDVIEPPSGTVKTVYVGCDKAIIEVRQTKYGTATIRYKTETGAQKTVTSDSSGVVHRFTLSSLTSGTAYNFDVVVTDAFGRDSTLKYLDQDKMLVNFTFTTLKDCPKNAEFSNVKVCKVTYDSAEIFWYTPNGEFDSKVVYGEQIVPTTVQDGDISGHPVKFHYVKIGNLKEKTKYYFYVESGGLRDDNNKQYYTFTTPVEFVKFDVRTLSYMWGTQPGVGVNIVNQDSKAYDSLELRLYFRDKEGFEKDLGARIDILVLYREDGFQDTVSGAQRDAIWKNLATQKPTKMPDTYDPTDDTYAFYLTIPLWGVQMRSQSRIRMDVIFDHWEQTRLKDLLGEAPQHKINSKDWSFGPHHVADGAPMEFPGVPTLPKEDVDASYISQPINYYVTVYRKNEYVWGYSPSQAELKTKKTQYSMTSQVTSPLINPTADYVFYARTMPSVDVTGWFKIEPTDGDLNDIWVNGVKQKNITSLYKWSNADQRYNFTIPVPVQNGKNNVDITLFAGASSTCEECYGCAVSNHSFYVEFQGAKQYPCTLSLKNELMQPLPNDTAKIDTTKFNIVVTDRNGNANGKSKDSLYVTIKNPSQDDSIRVLLVETGDSTGVFQTSSPIAIVDKSQFQSGPTKIAMNGGDKIWITYIDPTDPTDISEATLVSKADFPVASSGALFDSNGDGAIDRMVINYSIPLKMTPDSASFGIPAVTDLHVLHSNVDNFKVSGNQLEITFAAPLDKGITGFSSGTRSTAKSYLTSLGSGKTSVFTLYDSIGPVITSSVTLHEKTGAGDDTLTVTFSEIINIDVNIDSVLMVRHNGTSYGVKVLGVIDQTSTKMKLLVRSAGITLQEGDLLFINSSGMVTDAAKNHAHINNPKMPLVLKEAVPRVVSAFYTADKDGFVDKVEITFAKKISPEDISFGFKWENGTRIPVTSSNVSSIGTEGTRVQVRIKGLITGSQIITSGKMELFAVHSNFPKDTIKQNVADSAAPVITGAVLAPSPLKIGNSYIDTLIVTFSESVENVNSDQPFIFKSMPGIAAYSMKLVNSLKGDPSRQIFYISSYVGVEFPGSADSIHIDVSKPISDKNGNVQGAPENHYALMTARPIPFSVDMKNGPNPFTPSSELLTLNTYDDVLKAVHENKGSLIVLTPDTSRIKRQVAISGSLKIFDAFGSTVRKADFTSDAAKTKVYFFWNGRNQSGRLVGSGTYVAIVTIKNEEGQVEKKRLLIGVKR